MASNFLFYLTQSHDHALWVGADHWVVTSPAVPPHGGMDHCGTANGVAVCTSKQELLFHLHDTDIELAAFSLLRVAAMPEAVGDIHEQTKCYEGRRAWLEALGVQAKTFCETEDGLLLVHAASGSGEPDWYAGYQCSRLRLLAVRREEG